MGYGRYGRRKSIMKKVRVKRSEETRMVVGDCMIDGHEIWEERKRIKDTLGG
jgi:hypothetical protein